MLCVACSVNPAWKLVQIHDPHIAGLQVKIEMNIPMLLIETPVRMRLIWLQILLSYDSNSRGSAP